MIRFSCCIKKYHKIYFKPVASYIDFPDWRKKKKATINPKIKDDKSFQYGATVAVNYGGTKWKYEIASIIKLLITKYNRMK